MFYFFDRAIVPEFFYTSSDFMNLFFFFAWLSYTFDSELTTCPFYCTSFSSSRMNRDRKENGHAEGVAVFGSSGTKQQEEQLHGARGVA